MKNKTIIIIFSFIVVIIALSLIYFKYYPKPSNSLRWTQEYIAGQGNIKGDVDIYLFGTNSAYEIGANKDGYAVFKNPSEAFAQMKEDYSKGLSAIQKEFYFAPVSNLNFKRYGKYGWQLTTNEDENIKQQGTKITQFFDIYENSFK